MKKNNKQVSMEQVMRQYQRITYEFDAPANYPELDKKFVFNLIPFYLKFLEELKFTSKNFINLINPLKVIYSKQNKLSDQTVKCLNRFPEYKDFLNMATKYLKVKDFPKEEFFELAADCCHSMCNIYFTSENEDSVDLTSSAISAAIYKFGSLVSWYKNSKVVYSFKEKTAMEALSIMLNNSNFNGSEFLDLLEVGESKVFYIGDKEISFAGMITRGEDYMLFSTYNKYKKSYYFILPLNFISNMSDIQGFLKYFYSTVSFNCADVFRALSGFINAEGIGDTFPFVNNLKDKSFEDVINMPYFKDLIQLVAIGYYMTFSQKIQPEQEEVRIVQSKETQSHCKNIIKHYDVMESTIKMIKPKIKYEGSSKGSPKKPHYRRPHSHRFWEGSGENKRLVKHLVQGVCVNGYTLTPDDKYPKPRINNVI